MKLVLHGEDNPKEMQHIKTFDRKVILVDEDRQQDSLGFLFNLFVILTGCIWRTLERILFCLLLWWLVEVISHSADMLCLVLYKLSADSFTYELFSSSIISVNLFTQQTQESNLRAELKKRRSFSRKLVQVLHKTLFFATFTFFFCSAQE